MKIKLTAVGSGYWKVRVNGVVVSQHVAEREANEAATNLELANPADVVEFFHDAVVKVEASVSPVVVPPPPVVVPPVTPPVAVPPVDPGTPPVIPPVVPPVVAPPVVPPVPPEPPIPFLTGKYRYQSEQLFQTARSEFEHSHLVGGDDLMNDVVGPTYRRVASGWAWDNPGGDWIDAARTRQGKTAWFSVPANKASGETAVYAYSVDCTTALQFVQTGGRWNAFFMRCLAAPRVLAGVFNTKYAKPAINVVYVGGTTGVLRCKLSGASDNSTSSPVTTKGYIGLPVFLEFDKPTAAVQSAVMAFTITAHWAGSGPPPVIEFFVLDPSVNSAPTKLGVANTAALDAGLVGHSSIIGLHRYLDGAQLSSFTLPNVTATSSGFAFDPYIYQGSSAHDFTKYPHLGLGKFINSPAAWSLVDSGFAGDGFAPLAPGLGALRVPMVHDPKVIDGYNNNGYAGTSGAANYIFMPEPLFGLLDHIFVRYYTRIGTPNGKPYRMPIAQRYQMRQEPTGALLWADCAGKTGITPSHNTQDGGNSEASGGGWGWVLRHRWTDCTADETGPEVDGCVMGVHMDDFGDHSPVGYKYRGADGFNDSFNQQGGLGGLMHADTWYCVEMELKLNTVFAAAPGFTPDGEMRVWVDGRLAMEKTGMVFRSLPLMGNSGPNPPYNPNYIQPVRELGVTALWFNWYHGGITSNTLPRTLFVTGLAYGTEYIGPMKGVTLETPAAPPAPPVLVDPPAPPVGLPAWVPAANTVAIVPEVNSFASIDPGVSGPNGWSYNKVGMLSPDTWKTIINDFSGGVYNPYLGAKGSMIYHGGGHAATNWNGIVAFDFDTLTYSRIMEGSVNCYPVDSVNAEYADGQPMAPHSYDTLAILGPEAGYPKGALITPVRLAAAYESYNSTAVHLFDFANPSARWTRLAAHNSAFPSSPGGASAYDPDLGRVWWVSNTNESGYQQYFDLAIKAQKKITLTFDNSSRYPDPDSQCLRYDSTRKLLILIDVPGNGSTARRVQYFDTTKPAMGWAVAALSGALPGIAAGFGFAFDRVADGTYLCNARADLSKIYRLTVPAVLTDAWSVEPIAYAGVALLGAAVIGKRWAYIPALQSIVCKFTAETAHQIYRV